ncbi:predicted protein [Nematostella vectensis]|uniref:Uncharacterized protein n=1 Tax=Nematostella vectensis TaxID=45351 RepID=A7RMM0_NEMVE|nr:predicted protein [Nematostella vectensis]|eukprot:XP_001639431.1 predicted protein [Nematostella vectensis]
MAADILMDQVYRLQTGYGRLHVIMQPLSVVIGVFVVLTITVLYTEDYKSTRHNASEGCLFEKIILKARISTASRKFAMNCGKLGYTIYAYSSTDCMREQNQQMTRRNA